MAPTKPKTFKVRAIGGNLVETEQLATFTHTLCGEKFHFVVTRSTDGTGARVTDPATGYSVCKISVIARPSKVCGWRDRGVAALVRLVETHGEQRVYDVIAQGQRNVARNGS